MTTTSLKLPDEVKQLAVAAARQQGISPHAFMIDAIRAAAVAAEKRAAFVADAQASRVETSRTGLGFEAKDIHTHIREKARGRTARRPEAKKWRG
jgi:predicted transcriptional regulator